MKISQIMTLDVRAVGLHENLDSAARLMWEADCGSLPVVNGDGEVVAMLTDRDVCMHAWSQGRPLCELTVKGAMSSNLFTCEAADPVSVAERLMQTHQIRRLPVVDSQSRPVGFVSLTDLSREAMLENDEDAAQVRDEVVRTLAAVCQPR